VIFNLITIIYSSLQEDIFYQTKPYNEFIKKTTLFVSAKCYVLFKDKN